MSSRERRMVAVRNKDGGEGIAFSESLFPSRETIDSFEQYHKGAAAEILAMSRAEQVHTHKIESSICRRETVCQIMGMVFGVACCLALLASGVFLIYLQRPVGGYASIAIAFISLIASIANTSGNKGKQ